MDDLFTLAGLFILGIVAGYVANAYIGARVIDRIHAMNEVFRTWGDHIVSDIESAKAIGSADTAIFVDRINAREAAFKAWVATL